MFYQRIQRGYCNDVVFQLKNIANMKRKLTQEKNKRIYLLRSRNLQIIPKFLQLKVDFLKFENPRCNSIFKYKYDNFLKQVLNLLITECISKINKYKKSIETSIDKVKNTLPNNVLQDFIKCEDERCDRLFISTRDRQIKKLETLLNKNTIYEENNKSKWITNLTEVELPKNVEEVLQLGPKYAVPYNNNKVPYEDIIAGVEVGIETKNEVEKNDIRRKVSNILEKCKNKPQKQTQEEKVTNKKIQETKKFIKENPDIRILNADKSNATVIIYKEDYASKMKELLEDNNTYREIKRDPTNRLQEKNNKMVQEWMDEHTIDLKSASNLKIRNGIAPKIYGLPKIHKQNIPLRPIVSCIQSPLYSLQKYLTNILVNIVGKTKYHVKDSWEFAAFIKQQIIPPGYKIISLDVISLYTNIPTTTATIVIEKNWKKLKPHTKLDKEQFMKALDLCLNSTYFEFEGKIYEQIFGLPMGAPLSPVVANIVLEELEEQCLKKCTFEIPFYKRYMDDIVTAIPSNELNNVLNVFNSYHPKIQFTCEEETKNNELNFLDMTIKHENGHVSTTWFTKKTWTGRYTNYKSEIPQAWKNNVAVALTDRAIKLTTPENRKDQLTKVKKTLKENNFPAEQINKIIRERVHVLYNGRNENKKASNEEKTQKKLVVIPYVRNVSEKINKVLKGYDIQTVNKNNNTIRNIYPHIKSKTQKEDKTHTVYSIPCGGCEGTYVGQSKQYLKNRLRAHAYGIKGRNGENTALKKHVAETGHSFKFKETRVIIQEKNEKKRLIKEMIEIKKDNKSINFKQDIEGLSNIYFKLIKN